MREIAIIGPYEQKKALEDEVGVYLQAGWQLAPESLRIVRDGPLNFLHWVMVTR